MDKHLIVHVGTHKTGTKSIQLFLDTEYRALRESGIGLVMAGRIRSADGLSTPGNHTIAFALQRDDAEMELRALTREIEERAAPTVVISSEEFHPLHVQPDRLRLLASAAASIGYRTSAILYLRAQTGYLESLYAEYLKSYPEMPFDVLLRDVVRHGEVREASGKVLTFDYTRVVEGLQSAFGAQNVAVRPFDVTRPSSAVIVDFLDTLRALHGPLALQPPVSDARENTRATFAAALLAMQAQAMARNPNATPAAMIVHGIGEDPSDPFLLSPLAPLTHDEAHSIAERFADANARVREMTGVIVPGARAEDVPSQDDPRWRIAERQRRILDAARAAWFDLGH
ncbi:MAG: hypothetical protein KGN02_00465 [bacterium]|nr:hypothetical protein [bacterium]